VFGLFVIQGPSAATKHLDIRLCAVACTCTRLFCLSSAKPHTRRHPGYSATRQVDDPTSHSESASTLFTSAPKAAPPGLQHHILAWPCTRESLPNLHTPLGCCTYHPFHNAVSSIWARNHHRLQHHFVGTHFIHGTVQCTLVEIHLGSSQMQMRARSTLSSGPLHMAQQTHTPLPRTMLTPLPIHRPPLRLCCSPATPLRTKLVSNNKAFVLIS